MRILSFTLIIVLILKSTSKCIHEEYRKKVPLQKTDYSEDDKNNRRQLLETYSWHQIRITVDYTYINKYKTLEQDQIDYIGKYLIPSMLNFYKSTLKVYAQETLSFGSLTTCGGYKIPSKYLSSPLSTDLLILLTDDQNQDGVLAAAAACIQDGYTNRPVAGIFGINAKTLVPNNTAWEQQFATTCHEVTHVLGFTDWLYDQYVDPRTLEPLGLDKVVKNITIRGIDTKVIQTPKVLAYTRAYYSCPTCAGMELENQGGDGSMGSHWEKRIIFNEIMVADDENNQIYSQFTASLLEDMGWYKPDYTKLQKLYWGRGQGCNFLNYKCVNSEGATPFPQYFCNTAQVQNNDQRCTFDYTGQAQCDMLSVPQGTVIPPAMVYTPNPALMSWDQFMDNCPFPVYIEYGKCTVPLEALGWQNETSSEQYWEYVVGPQSRCWEGTFVYKDYQPDTQHTSCLVSECVTTKSGLELYVTLNSTRIKCPQGGGVLDTSKLTDIFVGTLVCPQEDLFCKEFEVQDMTSSIYRTTELCSSTEIAIIKTAVDQPLILKSIPNKSIIIYFNLFVLALLLIMI